MGSSTLGVEEEYQIVDPQTRELRSYISRLLEDGKSVLRERVRMEMHQSVVEVGTSICKNVAEVKSELHEMRGQLNHLARKGDLRIIAASTHPFSDWKTQDISPGERYHEIVADLQDIARANLIFGLHVHDRHPRSRGRRRAQQPNPISSSTHLLALTTSSPMWLGRKSGLKEHPLADLQALSNARASPTASSRPRSSTIS